MFLSGDIEVLYWIGSDFVFSVIVGSVFWWVLLVLVVFDKWKMGVVNLGVVLKM